MEYLISGAERLLELDFALVEAIALESVADYIPADGLDAIIELEAIASSEEGAEEGNACRVM